MPICIYIINLHTQWSMLQCYKMQHIYIKCLLHIHTYTFIGYTMCIHIWILYKCICIHSPTVYIYICVSVRIFSPKIASPGVFRSGYAGCTLMLPQQTCTWNSSLFTFDTEHFYNPLCYCMISGSFWIHSMPQVICTYLTVTT